MQKNGLSLILASFSIFSIMLVFFMTMSHGTSAAFFDVPATHPNSAAINYAQEQGIVGGYPDGSFQPDRILNRAEFAKIMIAARFSQGEIESCVGSPEFYQKKVLSDIEPGVWFEKYVCFAKKKGVIAGYPDGTFQGTRLINFAESAKISVESYGLEVGTGDPWFIPYLNELEERSAVPDSLARIGDPTQRGIMEITRGEMAEIVYRLRNIQDEVVSSDGALTMKISESALPEGVSLDTFSIRRMQEEENPLGTVNGAPMIFYDLGPDGFVFKQPITVQINLPIDQNTIPLVFLVSGGEFNMLPDPIIQIDQATNIASLTVDLLHFSQMGISLSEVLTIGPVVQSVSGTTVNARVGFEGKSLETVIDTTGKTLVMQSLNFSNVLLTTIPEEVFSPVNYHLSPFSLAPDQTSLQDRAFTCGTNVSGAAGKLSFTLSVAVDIDGSPSTSNVMVTVISDRFNCPSTAGEQGQDVITVEGSGLNPLGCQDNVTYEEPINGGVRVDVIKLSNGYCYDLSQFSSQSADANCSTAHYRSISDPVTNLDGTKGVNDPDPTACHFGNETGPVWMAP